MSNLHVKINNIEFNCNRMEFEKDLLTQYINFKVFNEKNDLYGMGKLESHVENRIYINQKPIETKKHQDIYLVREDVHYYIYVPKNCIIERHAPGFYCNVIKNDQWVASIRWVLISPTISFDFHLGNEVVVVEKELKRY